MDWANQNGLDWRELDWNDILYWAGGDVCLLFVLFCFVFRFRVVLVACLFLFRVCCFCVFLQLYDESMTSPGH